MTATPLPPPVRGEHDPSLLRRVKPILGIAVPVTLAFGSQVLVNAIDAAMVGSLGEAALAAVGQGGYAVMFATAPLIGLSSAVQAMVARRRGEGAGGEAHPLNAGLMLSVLLGVALTVPLVLAAPALFPLLNDDPDVVAGGVPYFQIRLLGMTAVGMGLVFRGYWNALSQSKLFLYTQVLSHVVNIAVSWCLIFGSFGLPELGVVGAAVGSAVAPWTAVLIYLGFALVYARAAGFASRMPSTDTMKTLVKLAVPTSMEQSFTYVSMNVLFLIIASIGTAEVAAATVLMNLVMVTLVPEMGLGIAANTFVSKSLGEKDAEAASRWGWDVAKIGTAALAVVAIPMVFAPDAILSVFLSGAPDALEAARLPLQLLGPTCVIDAAGVVFMHSLLGAGAVGVVMRTSMGLQLATLITCWIVGPVLGFGLTAVWCVHLVNRCLLTVSFTTVWRAGNWKAIKL